MLLSEKEKIKELAEKIKYNDATSQEYQEYYDILIKHGISKETVDNQLYNGNVKNITDLYLIRKSHNEERKKQVNRIVVASLVGIGIGILAYWAFKKKKKNI